MSLYLLVTCFSGMGFNQNMSALYCEIQGKIWDGTYPGHTFNETVTEKTVQTALVSRETAKEICIRSKKLKSGI